jgi:hypothetical protein
VGAFDVEDAAALEDILPEPTSETLQEHRIMDSNSSPDMEAQRLQQAARDEQPWRLWGTYLSDRQWGTVREDYSADGDVWDYFPYEQARSRAYRWGEDGLLGWTDQDCRLCFAPALWNGRDRTLKERLFGLSGPQGNHGEDVKELYFHEDATPTHSYCRGRYKYPQAEFPYQRLIDENARRGRDRPEFEIADTGVFDENRYFDVVVEYAKASPHDILIRLSIINRGPDRARLHVLPTLWFRNTWRWGDVPEDATERPQIDSPAPGALRARHAQLGEYRLDCDLQPAPADLLFTDNETNAARLFNSSSASRYVKDGFHDALIENRRDCINVENTGTKAALHFVLDLEPGQQQQLRLRLTAASEVKPDARFGDGFDALFRTRIAEADRYYDARIEATVPPHERLTARRAYAGLLWCKQFYHLVQTRWSEGDQGQPPPPPQHADRNSGWEHLYTRDVLSVPDKWEFPYFCAWDSGFHCVTMSRIDPDFAKFQLLVLLRDWYMHRNGQLPAYEFAFSDVNPPVHPWAVWRVYRLNKPGEAPDLLFLKRAFQKLLLNFTWWVNRVDVDGNNLFSGGFLGLDNIGVFDRSRPLPTGGKLQQADGTAWMAFYCVHMLSMALELAAEDSAYEDIASKFLEHFGAITQAINTVGGLGLWDEQDGFYYDQLQHEGRGEPLRVRSIVGFIPMFASTIVRRKSVRHLRHFIHRLQWETKYGPLLAQRLIQFREGDHEALLSVPSRAQLERMLRHLFDENEFLSPFGIRSLSRFHEHHPYTYDVGSTTYRVDYAPGEGTSGMFGGNSNWRGPVWFPINYLILESLRVYHRCYGDDLKVEFPTGSGDWVTLGVAARRLSQRLRGLFVPDEHGRRPCMGPLNRFAGTPGWQDLFLFNEYYHADAGRGCGASHQTGWTALVADLINLETLWEPQRGD